MVGTNWVIKFGLQPTVFEALNYFKMYSNDFLNTGKMDETQLFFTGLVLM